MSRVWDPVLHVLIFTKIKIYIFKIIANRENRESEQK